ncbi:hypothetical protein LC55x_5354 [Lysobacter capsici]|nr:hypothetical protein LC55x_5314 [Lysobacter capsici]ALN88600.1 hypothetical protein LC55x_5354 [Lysobacter capsici]
MEQSLRHIQAIAVWKMEIAQDQVWPRRWNHDHRVRDASRFPNYLNIALRFQQPTQPDS